MNGENKNAYEENDQNLEDNASNRPEHVDTGQNAVPNLTDVRSTPRGGQYMPSTYLPTAVDNRLEGQSLPPMSLSGSAKHYGFGHDTDITTQAQESTSHANNSQDTHYQYGNSYDPNAAAMQGSASHPPGAYGYQQGLERTYRGGYGQNAYLPQGYGVESRAPAHSTHSPVVAYNPQSPSFPVATSEQPLRAQNPSQSRRHRQNNKNSGPRRTSGSISSSREHNQANYALPRNSIWHSTAAFADGSHLPQQNLNGYWQQNTGSFHAGSYESNGQAAHAAGWGPNEPMQNTPSTSGHETGDEHYNALASEQERSHDTMPADSGAYAQPGSTAEAAPSMQRVPSNVPSTRRTSNDQLFCKYNSSEFWVGRVLKIVWPEPMGTNLSSASIFSTTQNDVFKKNRRFVILETYMGHSIGVPIMTYGDQGCKPGAHHEYHGIVYTSETPPRPMAGEAKLGFHPVRMLSENGMEQLHRASRVNYRKTATIEHNYLVNFVGYLDFSDFVIIQRQLQATPQGCIQYGPR